MDVETVSVAGPCPAVRRTSSSGRSSPARPPGHRGDRRRAAVKPRSWSPRSCCHRSTGCSRGAPVPVDHAGVKPIVGADHPAMRDDILLIGRPGDTEEDRFAQGDRLRAGVLDLHPLAQHRVAGIGHQAQGDAQAASSCELKLDSRPPTAAICRAAAVDLPTGLPRPARGRRGVAGRRSHSGVRSSTLRSPKSTS